MDDKHLYGILQINTPELVLNEVKTILNLVFPGIDPRTLVSWFEDTVNLFSGNYPGYQACNTLYHDLNHTLDTFLATARLMHGAVLGGRRLAPSDAMTGLKAALFHDTGYIQDVHDTRGTGAKYTLNHVNRSMEFFHRHGSNNGLTAGEITSGSAMIQLTNIAEDGTDIQFGSESTEFAGKALAAADLVSQVSDRIYLEKLIYLFQEFKEGRVRGYDSEEDLLRKTIDFYDYVGCRLELLMNDVNRYLCLHFHARWDIFDNLYFIAMEKQRTYLNRILRIPDSNPLDFLRRAGIVARLFHNRQNNP